MRRGPAPKAGPRCVLSGTHLLKVLHKPPPGRSNLDGRCWRAGQVGVSTLPLTSWLCPLRANATP